MQLRGVRTVNTSECPDWFWQYTQFHAANRGHPNAKYLVMEGSHGGLGDRLNGALGMLRVAMVLNRVLLVRWISPFPIQEFFEPAGPVNWTTQGITMQQGLKLNFHDTPGLSKQSLHDGSLLKINETWLTISTNMALNWTCYKCPKIESFWSEEASCLWQQMFRPVAAIQRAAAAELDKLYTGGARPYVAVHLRLGGLTGESGKPGADRGKAPLENFLASVQCASKLAINSSINLDETPALAVTDNHALRKALQAGAFKRVITPSGLPVHTGMAPAQSLEAHRSTVVDLVMLGWSQCIATSRSTFSIQAYLYGGAKPCTVPWTKCL